MTINIDKQLILESAKVIKLGKGNKSDELDDEIRYKIYMTSNSFNKLPPKSDGRIDWYFEDYRIRQFFGDSTKQYGNDFIKITGAGTVHKKQEKIKKQNIKELDDTCDFKNTYESKRPIVDNIELYLERVTMSAPNKADKIMYTTEVETKTGLKNILKILKITGVSKMVRLGKINMKQITHKELKL